MLDDYLAGSVGQLLERARHLLAAISKPYPPEFRALAQTCRNQVNELIAEFGALLNDPRYRKPELKALRLRTYTDLVNRLDFIESIGFAALVRINEEDKQMTRLVSDIAEEMIYPLPAPVVSCQSHFSSYFHAFPGLNVLRVPLKEGHFLLHLPDLYHELAHFILEEKNNPAVQPFQEAHAKATNAATGHLADLLSKPTRGPQNQQKYLTWTVSWMRAWATEFFCDLFGVLAVGPAYAWAHFHLCAKTGADPFKVETSTESTHPPDEARMFILLESLSRLNYGGVAAEIELRWKELGGARGYKKDADYQLCFANEVLKKFADEALAGYQTMNCRCSSVNSGNRVHDLLNEAWVKFWQSPAKYAEWEKKNNVILPSAKR
jgi:hypothetical protein